MNTFIVRQPIVNRAQKVEAYEIVYRQDSTSLYNITDAKAASAIISFFNQQDGVNILDGKDAFLTFTPNLLMQAVPLIFDEKKMVIQIEENVLINPTALEALRSYKEQGFRIALINFAFNRRYLEILPLVDIMKIDFTNYETENISKVVDIAVRFNKKTAAYNVNTSEALESAKQFDFDYIQGKSVADMVKSKTYNPEHLQSNFFRLMVAVTRDTPDFDEITQLISLDVTLAFSLIKLVNSSYFALPNRVKDIKQALLMLGLGQLRQWIYLLSFTSDGGLSDELIKLSFLRAIFCSNLLPYAKDLNISKAEAYMLGMFSTLENMLLVPMSEALKELPIADELKDGLLGKPSGCCDLLGLCVAYEKGEWTEMDKFAQDLEIDSTVIGETYLSSVEYVNETWNDLMKSADTND